MRRVSSLRPKILGQEGGLGMHLKTAKTASEGKNNILISFKQYSNVKFFLRMILKSSFWGDIKKAKKSFVQFLTLKAKN